MKFLIAFAMSVSTASLAYAQQVDPREYTISKIVRRQVPDNQFDLPIGDANQDCPAGAITPNPNNPSLPGNNPGGIGGFPGGGFPGGGIGFPGPIGGSEGGIGKVGETVGQIGMIIDQIINIGSSIWNVIERGKPVVNVKKDIGTALPAGAKCWINLQGWSRPSSKTYQVIYKNGFGAEVIRFTYRLLFIAGGNVKGVGKFIGYATIVPLETMVGWGWDFDVEATVPAVVNMGTSEQPIAGMQMEINYKVSNSLKYYQGSAAYFLDGNGRVDVVH